MREIKTEGGSSQSIDFSCGSALHLILTTKTVSSIPIKSSFTGKSIPNRNQGSLIRRISLGTIFKPQKRSKVRKKERIGSATPSKSE